MDEKKKTLFVRFAYWYGAILDALTFLMMVFPFLGNLLSSVKMISYDASYQYANALGAPLMIGWTFLLIWADRDPLERSEILLITLFPVMTGLIIANVLILFNGVIQSQEFLFRLFIQISVVIIYSVAYSMTRTMRTTS